MENEQVATLVSRYFDPEGYAFPQEFEHRFDPDSSAIMYSFIRHYKPKSILEVGSWLGGSTCIIMSALLKNKQNYNFVCSELDDNRRRETENNTKSHCGIAPLMIGDITKNLKDIPDSLDCIFIDTDHDRTTTEWIVEHIWPRVVTGGLFIMHDWAVWEENGQLLGKGDGGVGGLPEAAYLMDLMVNGKFPFKKLHWTYKNPIRSNQSPYWETAIWEKI